MTINQIDYFMAVVECQNISKAAEQLFMTQPALSRQITAMEDELGVQLFFRKSRPIQMTPAGRVFYEELKDYVEKYRDAVKKVQIIGSGVGGYLNFGVLPGVDISHLFTSFRAALEEKYPDIVYNAESGSFSDLMNGLRMHNFDFLITHDFGVEKKDGIETLVISNEPNYLVVSEMHPLAHVNRQLTLSDFKEDTFIVNAPEDLIESWDAVLRKCELQGFRPKYKTADNLDQYMLMVETGIGVAVLNGSSILRHHPGVVFLPMEEVDTNELVLVYDSTSLNPSVKKALEIFEHLIQA